MSVQGCTILGMTTTWNKHSYVCNSCDGLIEITINSYRTIDTELCPSCFNSMTLLSVEDATIQPTNEREDMYQEHNVVVPITTPESMVDSVRQELELTYGNKITELENNNSALRLRIANLEYNVEKVRDYLVENYDELELHADSIAEIIGVKLSKTTTYTVVVTHTVEITHDLDEQEPNYYDFSINYSGEIEYNGVGDMEIIDSDLTDFNEA